MVDIKTANTSEALECLEEIKSYFPFVDLGKGKEYVCEKEFNTIKQALLKSEKEHKALEIIKGKRVNVGTFIHFTKVLKKDYEQCKATNDIVFCNICDTEKDFLTEEEFDILKVALE